MGFTSAKQGVKTKGTVTRGFYLDSQSFEKRSEEMSESNFTFTLKITGPSKASLEISGRIGEAAKDEVLKILAADFEGKTQSPSLLVKKK